MYVTDDMLSTVHVTIMTLPFVSNISTDYLNICEAQI